MKSVRALDKFNQIVKISDVKSGAGDELFCIGCGGKLIARKGEVNAHHFAHLNSSNESGCSWGLESELHLLAKEAIALYQRISIPIGHLAPTGKIIELKDAVLETKNGSRIPDITAYYEGYPLLIEIAVTHKCGKDKIVELRKQNIDCIEYDLSPYDLIKNQVNNVEQVYKIIESSAARILSYCTSSALGALHFDSDKESHRALIIEARELSIKNKQSMIKLNNYETKIQQAEDSLSDKHNQASNAKNYFDKVMNDVATASEEHKKLKEEYKHNESLLELMRQETKLNREVLNKNEIMLELTEGKKVEIDNLMEKQDELKYKILNQDNLIADSAREISQPFIDELKDKIDRQNVHIAVEADKLDSWRFRQGIDSASRFRTSKLPQEERSAWLDMEIKRKEIKLSELNQCQ